MGRTNIFFVKELNKYQQNKNKTINKNASYDCPIKIQKLAKQNTLNIVQKEKSVLLFSLSWIIVFRVFYNMYL